MSLKASDSDQVRAPRPPPPVMVTLSDCDNEVPIRLVAGQALVIELTLDRATGYAWRFENMPKPRKTVSRKLRERGPGLTPDFGHGVQTYHYMWSAEQLACAGRDFVVTAALTRGPKAPAIKRTQFAIHIVNFLDSATTLH